MQIRNINWSEILAYMDVRVDYPDPYTVEMPLSIEPTVALCPQLQDIFIFLKEIFARHGIYLKDAQVEWLEKGQVFIPDSHQISEIFQNWRWASALSKEMVAKQQQGVLIYMADDNCDFYEVAAANDGHFAIGQEYAFGGNICQIIINMRGGETPTERRFHKDFPQYSNINMIVSLFAHEVCHGLGGTHDHELYNGHLTIMKSPLHGERNADDVFFSGKSIGEMHAYLTFLDVVGKRYRQPLLVNGEFAISVMRESTQDYVFSISKGKLLDIKVLTQPYERTEKNSLIEYVRERTQAYFIFNKSFEINNWEHKASAREGNYAYFGVVEMPDGKIENTAPCVVHLEV